MMASEVTDLPQPDSPTSPTTWPGSTSKLTPSTATASGSPRRWKTTRRSRTSSSGGPPLRSFEPGTQRRPFGSRASRSDSPSRVKPSATTMIATAG